jgi:hypothetical protein
LLAAFKPGVGISLDEPAVGGAVVVVVVGTVVVVVVGLVPAIKAGLSVFIGRPAGAAGCFGGISVFAALRIIVLTAVAALVITDLTAATTGTGVFAVVVHVPGDWREPQLVVLVWQQPQSCVTLGWSLGFACAPFVPWVL